ncbi:Acd 1-aminocyclopropane-1-carboxylate deaminase [Flavobacteriaceae bacterium]
MNQIISYSLPNGISLEIKREDLLHPFISGNKFRKLKYNLLQAKVENQETVLTFGGAYSNHIAAVAYAGKEQGFKTIGVIRGDELADKIVENPTLQFAQECGMQFEFVTREAYRFKTEPDFIANLQHKFGSFYLVPEGGTNEYAIKGCEEILTKEDAKFDYVCCAVGTGGTISGIINSALPHQKVLGFPALKVDFLKKDETPMNKFSSNLNKKGVPDDLRQITTLSEEIRKFATNTNWELITDYHFGGYGKVNEELIQFINQFYKQTQVPLDPVYTGKMVFGVIDLIQKNYFSSNTKILLIHTGGLQGIQGMNALLKKKNKTLIEVGQ